MSVDNLISGQPYQQAVLARVTSRFLTGFWEMASSLFKIKIGREAPILSQILFLYECDAPNCDNHEGRWSENRLACLQWQKGGKNPALSEVRAAESINAWGLPTQVVILWKKIPFLSGFSTKHPNSFARDHVYTYFYSTQDLTTVVGCDEERKCGSWKMNGLGRAKTKNEKCSGLVQAQFFTAFYHSQPGASPPETCGSLPNAELPCCLNLLPN